MFTLKPALLIRFTHKSFIRRLGSDPGIGLRKKMLSKVDDGELEIPDFDDLESDFMDIHKSHKQHLRQLEAMKERNQFLLVRQKYFKEKFPNFLTWHDKEQIRYLHRTNPEEWTFEKLSEGFPALPETIKKVIKSNWTKHKTTNHDKSVQNNWERFKCGKMPDLPQDLKEHLNKFTNRALDLGTSNNQRPVIKSNVTRNTKSDFSEIITSYNATTVQIKEKTEDSHVTRKPSSSKKKALTLEQLKENINRKLETADLVDEEEKVIAMILKSQQSNVKKFDADAITNFYRSHRSSTSVQVYEKATRELSHLHYPEKISIPKGIFKKGFLYKLNDCYYDDDGEFLYRVPGMD